jgi:hypothetical protein
MAEPITIAATITTLVTKAFSISQQVYNQTQLIRNAPQFIKAITNDLEDFYSILGTLMGYLEDEELSAGLIHSASRTNIDSALENCLSIFTRINIAIKSFEARGRTGAIGSWHKIKYSFMKDEIEGLGRELCAYKMTLNMAISLANL